jgi:hypothetical protein
VLLALRLLQPMPAEIVFSGGHTLRVPAEDAAVLMQRLSDRSRPMTPTGPGPVGWVRVDTDKGVVHVNPGQVAFVRDVEKPAAVTTTPSVIGDY